MSDDTDFVIVDSPGGFDCVVKARGDIDLHSAARFQDTLLDALIDEPARLIGVDVLWSARQRAYAHGTTMTVEAASPTVLPILEQQGFDTAWATVAERTAGPRADRARRPFPIR